MADRDSYIFRQGVSPNTLSVISSKNRVFAYDSLGNQTQIGVLSTFDPSETRSVEAIRGIGFGDRVAELVPGVTDPMTISVTRTALYLANIFQVFGYKAGVDGIIRSLRHHRWPFDIRQEIVFSALATSKAAGIAGVVEKPETADLESTQALLTIYEACWLADYNTSFTSDTAIVQESVSIHVSDIISDVSTLYDGSEGSVAYSTLSLDGKGLSNRLK